MRVVVSFCIFGSDLDDIYHGGAIQNASDYYYLRPEWETRFYYGSSIPIETLMQLTFFPSTSLIRVDGPENQTSTAWRYRVLRESSDYDFFLFRDVDSRFIPREAAAVQEWMLSGQDFHVMRDHPYHSVPMLAGLWGCTSAGAQKISGLVPDSFDRDLYQVDQIFLRQSIWPTARRRVLAHNFTTRWRFESRHRQRQFTIPRQGLEFVGEGYYATGRPRFPEHRELLKEG